MGRVAVIVHPQPDGFGQAGLSPRGVPGGLHQELRGSGGQRIGEGMGSYDVSWMTPMTLQERQCAGRFRLSVIAWHGI
jgi:hypothetical protein